MWQRIVNPRVLVYLDVSYEVSMQRRKLNLTVKEFEEQLSRLSHARQNAQIYVNTDLLSPAEVQHLVSDALEDLEIET
jgi:thymidylate kinase